MNVFFKTNLFIGFHISELKNLKIIYNLYPQCLTQALSKMTLFFSMNELYSISKSLTSGFPILNFFSNIRKNHL